MRGVELSRRYFEQYGMPCLREQFPELLGSVAAGVCGQGSENFGFDDEISRDHDFDPGFYLWLPGEIYRKWEFRLSRAYDRLPEEFEGVALIGKSVYENARHGVRETGAFFESLTGFRGLPPTNAAWLAVPSFRFASAVNGEIFYDGAGEVTQLRRLLASPPEDVWNKLLARALVFAAQSGQYNLPRLLKRGETGGAALALSEYVKAVCEVLFLLNRRWAPFYKWLIRGAKALPELGALAAEAEALLLSPVCAGTADRAEALGAKLAEALRSRGLTACRSDFLEPHAYEIFARIEDPALKGMHIME